MSKQLLLIRHAKSDWGNPRLSDFKRPLNERGERDAPEMARRLLEKQIIPQQMVSSSALRAITTAEHFARILRFDPSQIIRQREIYDALTYTLMSIVNDLADQSDFTALFGHNPSITALVRMLCDVDLVNIPTCGMALIRFPFDSWKMISGGTGELVFYDYPKNRQETHEFQTSL